MSVRPDGQPGIVAPSPRYIARLQKKLQKRLPMWAVYSPHTREYPGYWVARMHVALPKAKATRFVITHHTVEDLRILLPEGLFCLGRQDDDAPEIVEVWMSCTVG